MPQEKTRTREKKSVKEQEPKRYKVIMHNDDVTTMDFVVKVLETVFFKNTEDAEEIMLMIHNEGQAIVGVYPYDVANSKIFKVKRMAADEHFPLKLTMQEE